MNEDKRMRARSSVYFFCSSRVFMVQGSGEAHCWGGTPSSNNLATTAEKLGGDAG
jgi:hypothetical protein